MIIIRFLVGLTGIYYATEALWIISSFILSAILLAVPQRFASETMSVLKAILRAFLSALFVIGVSDQISMNRWIVMIPALIVLYIAYGLPSYRVMRITQLASELTAQLGKSEMLSFHLFVILLPVFVYLRLPYGVQMGHFVIFSPIWILLVSVAFAIAAHKLASLGILALANSRSVK